MAINLTKGGNINLAKEAPGLNIIGIGMGWDVSQFGAQCDLDSSIFLLGNNGKIPAEDYFVFYNNLRSPDGCVEHKGDNRTGAGDGDDEMIVIDLSKSSPGIETILFTASIHESELRRQSFGQIKNAYIRVYDMNTKREIAKYELNENFSGENTVEFGKLTKEGVQWRFTAVGNGTNNGLQGLIDRYA